MTLCYRGGPVDTNRIFEILTEQIYDVEPDLEGQSLTPEDSMRDLGIDSMSRVEILMLTMEELDIQMPNTELAKARNLGDVVQLFSQKLQA